MSTSDYEQCLKDCIKQNHQVIFKLEELLVTVEHHHQSCNTIRTYGTAAGIAGAGLMIGSMFAAPFHDRLSVSVTLAAAGVSLGGAATNLLQGFVDRTKSQGIIDEIQTLVRSRDPLMSKLKEESNHLTTIIKHLTANGLSEEQAVNITLNVLTQGDVDLKSAVVNNTFCTALVTLGRVLQVQFDVLKGIGTTSSNVPVFSAALAGSHGLIINTIGGFALLSRAAGEIGVLDPETLKISNPTIGFSKLMATAALITSVVISVVDLAFLVRHWLAAHPTVNMITHVRHQLQEETKSFEDILSTIEQVRQRRKQTIASSQPRVYDILQSAKVFQQNDSAALPFRHVSAQGKRPVKSTSFDERTRDVPVINNDVLHVQREIIKMFLQQRFAMKFDQLKKIPLSSAIYRAYHHPFSSEVHYHIQSRMVARLMNESMSTKVTELLYDMLIDLIRNSGRDQMIYLYDHGAPQDSPHISVLQASKLQMVRTDVYVDDRAFDHWLRVNGGDKRAYEQSHLEVYRMFINLDGQIRIWVNELKSFGY